MARHLLILLVGLVLGGLIARGLMSEGQPQVASDSAVTPAAMDRREASRRAESGAVELVLDTAMLELAGIESSPLAPVAVTPALASYGRVADRLALIDAQAAIADARAVAAAQRATQAALSERLTRLREFARAGEIGVAQELTRLELEARREAALATERESQVRGLERALSARWGEDLVTLPQRDPDLWQALVAGRECLLEFVLPAAMPTVARAAAFEIARDGERSAARPARVLAPAPATLGASQGARWFAATACGDLQSGQRVSVWLPTGDAPLSGALLPAAAMVWHAGQRWYFVETAPGHYQRRLVPAHTAYGHDAVLSDAGILPVVVRGAQTLLAEEQRAAIPEEDDD